MAHLEAKTHTHTHTHTHTKDVTKIRLEHAFFYRIDIVPVRIGIQDLIQYRTILACKHTNKLVEPLSQRNVYLLLTLTISKHSTVIVVLPIYLCVLFQLQRINKTKHTKLAYIQCTVYKQNGRVVWHLL